LQELDKNTALVSLHWSHDITQYMGKKTAYIVSRFRANHTTVFYKDFAIPRTIVSIPDFTTKQNISNP